MFASFSCMSMFASIARTEHCLSWLLCGFEIGVGALGHTDWCESSRRVQLFQQLDVVRELQLFCDFDFYYILLQRAVPA